MYQILSSKKTLFSLLAAAILILVVINVRPQASAVIELEPPDLQELGARMLETPLKLQPFQLVDHNAQTFNNDRLKGKWTFLYFGYVSCPDLCPTTLAAMNEVYNTLEKTGKNINDSQFIFVSVDPHRDSLKKIGEHVTFFNKNFIGVTGQRSELDKFVLHVGAKYGYQDRDTRKAIENVENQPLDADYIVRHFGDLFVFNPESDLVAYIFPPHGQNRVITVYNKIRQFLNIES